MKQALSQGRLAEAADILGRLKREDPLSRETRGYELEYYLASERLGEAESLAKQLCRTFPDSARVWFLAGKLAYRQKRYSDAETCFRESQRIYPSNQTQLWLGKTLTQTGEWNEAESLLTSVRDRYDHALLDLGWLYERKGDLEAALGAYDAYLAIHPDHEFASSQRVRIKARSLEPEALIEEVDRLVGFGEQIPASLFADYVEKLLDTGQGTRARETVRSRLSGLDPRLGTSVGWVCYRKQAYDLACDLFLAFLESNLANFKYLNSLEAAATKCNRVTEVIEAYKRLAPSSPKLHGRLKTLFKRIGSRG
jgi:tetratricopeptide (TPR) repeat protein